MMAFSSGRAVPTMSVKKNLELKASWRTHDALPDVMRKEAYRTSKSPCPSAKPESYLLLASTSTSRNRRGRGSRETVSPGSKQQTQNKERSMSSWPCFCNELNGRDKKEWREEEGAYR